MELVIKVYATTERLPSSEKYGLTSQLRRAAVSIPSALAEGHARASTKEFARYVSIAQGSLAEMETQLELSAKLDLVAFHRIESLLESCAEQGRILRGLQKSLSNKITARSRILP